MKAFSLHDKQFRKEKPMGAWERTSVSRFSQIEIYKYDELPTFEGYLLVFNQFSH